MSRTSDNPLRPRLASSPSPLPRGTFGYRQDHTQLSPQGLTQTPLAPAGEETRHGPPLNAPTHTNETRASAARRKANRTVLGGLRADHPDPSDKRDRIQKRASPRRDNKHEEPPPKRERLQATRPKPTSIETYFVIFVTRPAPTVRPPSRIAKRKPSSIAIGEINSTDISVLSPGITISVPSGKDTDPVTSVVRK